MEKRRTMSRLVYELDSRRYLEEEADQAQKKSGEGGGRRSLTPSHVAINSARRYTEPEGK